MSREFTKKEIVLILILVAILMGLLYYQFIFTDIQNKKASFDTADVEDEIMIEETKANTIANMQAEIEANKGNESTGYVETYNNLKAEINMLNDIFSDSDTFSFGFDQVTADGDAVRRNINATFTTKDYATARKIITELHDSKYRCLIRNLAIAAQGTKTAEGTSELDLNNGPVSVSLTVEFFETLYGATSTDGLDIATEAADTGDSSLTDTLSNETDTYENLGTE
ncbi:MAG: hypothetical protein GX685_11965 [Clostridiales bacterium]|nr:hypothetical protein [Clostridiales bacterium]